MDNSRLSGAFISLVQIMDDLRESCPWDKKQTFQSLRNLTTEECFELTDAILQLKYADIKEELGDLLLHILFYSKMASEIQQFDICDVLESISEKLVVRHPHIYGDVIVNDENEVKQNWEKIKQKEKKKGVLSGVPVSLPAVVKAFRIQEKASQVGFDWKEKSPVLNKVREELNEFLETFQHNESNQRIEEEFGDLLFSLVNLSRFIKIDPEAALERTNRKFIERFEFIEKHASKPLTEMSLTEMDELWKIAKTNGI